MNSRASDDQPVTACGLEVIPNSNDQPVARCSLEVIPHLCCRADQPEAQCSLAFVDEAIRNFIPPTRPTGALNTGTHSMIGLEKEKRIKPEV